MLRITQEDIQRIGDEETLLHFLEEKLNLPIPKDLTLEDITIKFAKFALGLSGAVANQVLDCQEPSVVSGEPSGIILIRFNSESGYAEALRAVAEGLDRQGRNPADLYFICMKKDFQPFALANFNDSTSKDWQSAVLNILTWTQENIHIHTSTKHELPIGFLADIPAIQPVTPTSPESLISKLENIGSPLSRSYDVYTGCFVTGRAGPFVIDDSKRKELIKGDKKSDEIIKHVLLRSQQKWKTEPACLIEIRSSHKKQWPWSSASNEAEAEQIFTETYSAISTHLNSYRDKLKTKSDKGKFWWELKSSNHSVPHHPKIVYPSNPGIRCFMRAGYDETKLPTQDFLHSILTTDLSLLAILNSKLFNWYAQARFKDPGEELYLNFSKKNMKKAPITERTDEQQAELSSLVQRILDDPDSLKVRALEWEIDQLVYKLYELTPAEIALIEKGTNP